MHCFCTYLNFKYGTVWCDYGCVERSISIWFRKCNVIFHTFWQRPPEFVHNSEYLVALFKCLYDNSNRKVVIDIIHVPVSALQLLVQAERTFRSKLCMKISQTA